MSGRAAKEQPIVDHKRVAKLVTELLEAIGELPQRDRQALRLHYFHDFSLERIADELGTTPAAVSMILHRARKKLSRSPGLKELGQ